MVDNRNQSYFAQPIIPENFRPIASAILAVGTATSASVTVPAIFLSGTICSTFKITNKGNSGAYIGWGNSNAGSTTVAVTSTSNFGLNCDYVAKGAILTQDFQSINGVVDTIAAIGDAGVTNLEISYGYGQ